MADTPIELGAAPANVERTVARTINEPALDRLEAGNCELGYISALNHAIGDALEHIRASVARDGAKADEHLLSVVLRADTLLCLQQERCDTAEAHITFAANGWPTTLGHRL